VEIKWAFIDVFFELIPQEKLLLVICGIPEIDIGGPSEELSHRKDHQKTSGMEMILHVLRMEQ
jgi:hypothetical protein